MRTLAHSPAITIYYSSVTSTLVTALEIWPPSKCRRAKLDNEIKCRRDEISRKYGRSIAMRSHEHYSKVRFQSAYKARQVMEEIKPAWACQYSLKLQH